MPHIVHLLLLPLVLLPLLPLAPSWPEAVDSLVWWGREHPTLWAPLVRGALWHLEHLASSPPPAPSPPPPLLSTPPPGERVCVVGGGPAGLHMALMLQDRGFTRVTIFERWLEGLGLMVGWSGLGMWEGRPWTP